MMHIIEELRSYVGFGSADEARLLELGPHVSARLEEVVTSFYEALLASPRSRAIFSGDAQLARLRHSLRAWLDGLFCGDYGAAYFHARQRIGEAHVEAGVDPHLVSGAINIIRRRFDEIARQVEPKPGALREHLDSLHKLLDLELAIMQQTYWDLLTEQKLKVPQAVAVGLAHEIRNPLNSIVLNLTLLERRMNAVEACRAFAPSLEVMRQEVRRIGSLTHEIMDFSKPIELEPNWHLVRELIGTVRALHGPTLAAHGVALEVAGEGGEVWCDRDRVIQALGNLINNATEALSGGGAIRIEASRLDRATEIEVSDDGPGMDPSWKFRVFEIFFTSKTTGTGLGLPIVKKIVEAHGGRVSLATNLGAGARFTISLPHPVGSP